MTIDIFTKEQFEEALPVVNIPDYKDHQERDLQVGDPLWLSIGMVQGEYCYLFPIDGEVAVEIRSSVKSNGQSAPKGKDSIRCWLVTYKAEAEPGSTRAKKWETKPLGSKVSKFITRIPGWEGRLVETLRTLWTWRKKAGNCAECEKPMSILKAKTIANKGRVFAKCFDHPDTFVWITDK